MCIRDSAGSGDALVLDGSLRSSMGVNLRPGGVDANGGVYDRIDDQILLGSGNGFALSNAELGRISAPEVVIGSSQHAGAIHVQEAITRSGNLTLQNSGGSGGIDLQAGVNVGNYTPVSYTHLDVYKRQGTGLTTHGGTIAVTGTSAGGVGVQLGDGSNPFAVGSSGGAITIHGIGVDAGVLMQNNQVTSGGGAVAITGSGAALGVSLTNGGVTSAGGNIDINGDASAADGVGVNLDAPLTAGAGQVNVQGLAASGRGIQLGAASGINTTTGSITLTGVGASSGLSIGGGTIATTSGHVDLRGRSTAPGSDGLAIANGVTISSNGGGVELSGEGTAAGLRLGTGAVVDAGNSLIIIRAANAGSGDALVLDGSLCSSMGVNLRPGGVDANGGVYDRIDDQILLGSGNGFALSNAAVSYTHLDVYKRQSQILPMALPVALHRVFP